MDAYFYVFLKTFNMSLSNFDIIRKVIRENGITFCELVEWFLQWQTRRLGFLDTNSGDGIFGSLTFIFISFIHEVTAHASFQERGRDQQRAAKRGS